MAFGDTRNQQFNQNIRKLLDYFLEQNLMKQRYAYSTQLAQEQARGWMEHEELQSKNLMDRMKMNYQQQLSRDPEISRIKSEIFMKRQLGEDTGAEESLLQQRAQRLGAAAYRAVKGSLSEKDAADIMQFTDEAMRDLFTQFGQTTRQKEMIGRVHEPGLRLEAIRAGQKEREMGLEWEKLKTKRIELSDEQTKATLSFVKDVEDFLISQGVKPSDMRALIQEVSTGRVLNPLSAEYQGQALQWLGEIRLKLAKRQPITEAEERFLTTVRNVYSAEPPTETTARGAALPTEKGGLVSPKIGLRPGEEERVSGLIEQKVQDRMYNLLFQGFKNRGFSDETAAYHARNLLNQLK